MKSVTRRVQGIWTRSTKWFGVAVVSAAGLATLGGAGSAGASSDPPIPKGPITVGGIYPLSGPYAAYGTSELKGTQGLIDNLNAHGGIDGHHLKFISLNDQLSPSVDASDAQELIADGAKAVFSVGTDNEAPAAVPILMKAHIPVIFYNSNDTWGSGKKWPYYFQTGYSNYSTALSLVEYAKYKGDTKVGLASDTSAFGLDNVADVVKAAKAEGLTIVKTVTYPVTVTSLATQMAELKAAGAQGVIIGGAAGYNQAFAAMNATGWTPDIFAFPSVLLLPSYAGLAGTPQAAHAYVACSGYCNTKGVQQPTALTSLTTLVESHTGTSLDPSSGVINGSDSLAIYAYALKKANTLDGTAIMKAIETIKDQSFLLPQLKYTFTADDHLGLQPGTQPIASVALGLGPQGNSYLAPGSTYSDPR